MCSRTRLPGLALPASFSAVDNVSMAGQLITGLTACDGKHIACISAASNTSTVQLLGRILQHAKGHLVCRSMHVSLVYCMLAEALEACRLACVFLSYCMHGVHSCHGLETPRSQSHMPGSGLSRDQGWLQLG